MSSQRTIFLSCNDVTSLDFCLFIHDSIIGKEVKNLSKEILFHVE